MPNVPKPERHPNDYQYFFVRGFARSGTNWMENILNLHPAIQCCGEFDLNDVRVELDRIMEKHWWALLHPQEFRPHVQQRFGGFVKNVIFDHARLRGLKLSTQWLGDRTPRPLQPLLVEDCRHFMIVRDGRDVLVSWTYHAFNLKLPEFTRFPAMQAKSLQFQSDPKFFIKNPRQLLTDSGWVREMARRWAEHCRSDLKLLEQTKQEKKPARICTVRYEGLHANPQSTREEMYRFLDLDPARALPLDTGYFRTSPGHGRDDPTDFYRKGEVGDWKNYFSDETNSWFVEESEDVMRAWNMI